MKKLTVQIGSISETRELRSGDFFLMPENPEPPVIVSDLDRNIRQKTWIREFIEGQPSYFEVQPIFEVYTIVAGTELEMFIIAEDPSLVDANSIGDDNRLQYVWKKDGSPIVPINALQNGKGIPGLSIPASDVDSNVAGIYTCEVSNAYGTTTSARVRIQIVEPKKHPMMFRNILKNGSSTQNWVTDVDVITRSFLGSEPLTRNYGSLPRFSYYDVDADRVVGGLPEEFRFCQGGHSSLLYNLLRSWYKKDKQLYNTTVNSNPDRDLEGWEAWLLRAFPSQIVPNEDLENWKYAGFFPGLKWIDSYNKNKKVIGLANEVESQVLTYITRDKIKFKKDGGKEVSTANQVVDLTDMSSIIDGQVTGVPQIAGQFFAYVGAGITGYKIKAQTESGEQLFNWYVLDPEDFFERLKSSKDNRISLIEDSIIEIIPLMEDITEISISTRNNNNVELSRIDLEGPSVSDVFAIKEKSQLPLTWYPIFEMFVTSNNEIQIFGQKYSDTTALRELMSPSLVSARRVLGYEYRLKLKNFSGGAGKRRRFKNTLNNYGFSDTYGEQIIASNGEINLTSFISRKESEGYNIFDFTPKTPTTTPGWQYKRVREHYAFLKLLLESIDLDIKLSIIETPIYEETRGDNEKTRIHKTPVTQLDRNAAFFIKKVPYKEGGSYYPVQVSEKYGEETAISEKRTLKALQDYGAAAMFAVGDTFAIPKGTRSIQVSIKFTHTSEAIDDNQPEMRGWTNPEIYRNDFGSEKSNSKRFVEYGYPRCGVSMARLMLITPDATVSDDYASYFIPPPESTVLGLRRKKLYENTNDTSEVGTFNYELLIPNNLPEFKGIDLYSLNDSLEAYERGVRKNEKDLTPTVTVEEVEQFNESVVEVEDNNLDRLENIDLSTAPDNDVPSSGIDTTESLQ